MVAGYSSAYVSSNFVLQADKKTIDDRTRSRFHICFHRSAFVQHRYRTHFSILPHNADIDW